MKQRRSEINREIARLTQQVSEETGLEPVKFVYLKERGRWILRITINKEGGVTLDDCERFSRAMSCLLDEGDIIEERYYLEVESPGIEI